MSFRMRVLAAGACALLAVVLMAGYASSVRSEAAAQREGALRRYGGETTRVCVAARDIARGETYTERNVETVEWLVDLLPEGALSDESQVMGMTASSAVAANTPLASVDVEVAGTQLEVPEGLSAVSVPCTAEGAVGGALAPGAEVDVYRVSEGEARLVCQAAQVLATNASGTGANLSWATLAVEPQVVEALVAAAGLQRLYFVLPGEGAREAMAQLGASQEALGEGQVPGEPQADAPAQADGDAEAGERGTQQAEETQGGEDEGI